MTSYPRAFVAPSWGLGFEEPARWTSRSTASIPTFPIRLKAAGARPDGWCAWPMQRSCSGCSVSSLSISVRPSCISAVPAPSPPRAMWSQMKLVPGGTVKAGEEIAEVISPEQDSIVATYMRALADIAGRTAELRIKARVAQDLLEAARAYLLVTQEAVERLGAMSTATVTFRMEVS